MRNKLSQNSINPQFKALRWQLLGAYLVVMVAIELISNALVYNFFARNLYQQVDYRLSNLAQAASHNLIAIKQNHNAINHNYPRCLDGDGDLDIPWQNLREPSQSVEWFDFNQKPLGIAGKLSPNTILKEGLYTDRQKIRSLTIVVYNKHNSKIEGYIRASESIQPLETVLIQLYWGFGLGGIFALGLIGLGGMWLTNQSLKPIEKSYQQLKQFTTDASHELRSPLAIIKTSVEVMQTHPERIHPTDELKFSAVVSATNQMSHLVDNLLLLARTERITQNTPPEWIFIPLEELLEDVVAFLEFLAEAKKIVVQENWQTDITVRGDSVQLHRLFTNLINNALQYTPSGGTIRISLHKSDRFAIVQIEDTGIGIAPENIPLIFERFWRSEEARLYREEGSGLGLAIALALAKKHGGDLTVTSVLKVGSCFTVRLPLAD